MMRGTFLGFLLTAILAGPSTALPQDRELIYEQVWIPVKQSLKLEATLYKPDGAGPFPLVLFSHGSRGSTPVDLTLRPDSVARVFVAKGIAVLAPMRRGRGKSGGNEQEAESTCYVPSLWSGIQSAVEDTDAALDYARSLQFVDAGRIVLAGQSRGGLLSVLYAARRPGSARGVVNFAGGWVNDRSCNWDFNLTAYRQAAETIAMPMLWLYTTHDHLYSAASIRSYAAAFDRSAVKAQLHFYQVNGAGHYLYRYPDQWKSALEAFLGAVGMLQAGKD